MRIAIDARNLTNPVTGVGRYLINLLKIWDSDSSNNRFILFSDKRITIPFGGSHIKNVVFRGHPFLWKQFLLPANQFRHKFDLIFSPSYSAPILKYCPTVVTIHDLTPIINPEWTTYKQSLRFRSMIRLSAKTSNRIIAVSESTRKDIIKKTGVSPKKVVVIYEGVDDIFCKKTNTHGTTRKFGIERPFILYVGSIHPRRNLKRLIEAFNHLKTERNLQHQLVLVGLVLQKHHVLADLINKSPFRKDIIALNYIPDKDLINLYNASDLFIYPSLYEGFGLPVLEAMACGTPVITSNVSSLPEIAGDAAYLINPYHTNEIVKGIDIILNEKSMKEEMVQKGFERVRLFTWKKAAAETQRLFSDFIISTV